MEKPDASAITPVINVQLPSAGKVVATLSPIFAAMMAIIALVWVGAVIITNKAEKTQVQEVKVELQTIKTDIAVIKMILQKGSE